MPKIRSNIFSLIFCIVGITVTHAQETLFDRNEKLEMTISTDFKQLFKRQNDTVYFPASIIYFDKDSLLVEFRASIKTRGTTRRSSELCNFPPLLLKFDDTSSLKKTIFRNFEKLKVVTHCQNIQSNFEQLIILEYLVYRMYNELTDYSFKVRLAEITYIDAKGRKKEIKKLAYLIEDQKSLAQRTITQSLENENIHQEHTQREMMTLLTVFEFMIGNTDWSVPKLHNIKLLSPGDKKLPIAIPYDFDGSGFVNSPYAKPSESLPISSVVDRLYRGYSRSEEELNSVFDLFREKKESFYQLILAQENLQERYKKRVLLFLDDFYRIIDDPKLIKKYFIDNFRN